MTRPRPQSRGQGVPPSTAALSSQVTASPSQPSPTDPSPGHSLTSPSRKLSSPSNWLEGKFISGKKQSKVSRGRKSLLGVQFSTCVCSLTLTYTNARIHLFQGKNPPKAKYVYVKREGLKAPPLKNSPLQRTRNLSGSTPARKESKPGAALLQEHCPQSSSWSCTDR